MGARRRRRRRRRRPHPITAGQTSATALAATSNPNARRARGCATLRWRRTPPAGAMTAPRGAPPRGRPCVPRRAGIKSFNLCLQCHFCDSNLIQKKTAGDQASRVSLRGRVRRHVSVSLRVRSASRSGRSQWRLGWCAWAIRRGAWREEHLVSRRMRLQQPLVALRYPASTMAVHRLPGLWGRPALAGLMP